ncbi:hypothetical protein [Acidaminobacterium chupaoyuni]
MNHSQLLRRIAAVACSAALVFSLAGCSKETAASKKDTTAKSENTGSQSEKDAPKVPDGPLTEESYTQLLQGYYDKLMEASSQASQEFEAINKATTDDAKKKQLEYAMGLFENVQTLYDPFIDIKAPDSFTEAQTLISSGASASQEVLRLTVKMSRLLADENKIAEARVVEKEISNHTKDQQKFSQGLAMVLGDSVGVGDPIKTE